MDLKIRNLEIRRIGLKTRCYNGFYHECETTIKKCKEARVYIIPNSLQG